MPKENKNHIKTKKWEESILQLQEANEALRQQLSEHHRSESALRESEERFRRMFFDSPDATAISRMEDGLFVEVNDRFTEVTGYTREEAIGKTSLELNILSDPEDRARLITGLKQQGAVINFEALFRMKDGTFITGLTSATPITLNGIPHILTTHRLIGDIKKVEEDLRRQTRQLGVINDLARKAASSLDPESVIAAVLENVMETLETSVALIFFRRNEDLHLRGSRTTKKQYAQNPDLVHRVGQCLCGLAAKEALPVYSIEIHKDPRCTWDECKLAGLRSFAALPLVVHEEVVGVLGLGNDKSRDFEAQGSFLESIAATTSLSLQNSMLFKELEKRSETLENEVDERTAELDEKNRELARNVEELQKANSMLERVNKLFVGRELKMIELKETIRELEKTLSRRG